MFKKKGLFLSITFLFFIGATFSILFFYTETPQKVEAIETECPEEMSVDACISFLQEQSQLLKAEQSKLKTRISSEEYEQLNLYEKISYFSNEIARQTNEIKRLEIEVEKNRNEIIVLEKEIKTTEDNVNVQSQEINRLEKVIQERVVMAYKNKNSNVIEILFTTDDFKSLDKKLFYLKKAREKDQEFLASMSVERELLMRQIEILAKQKKEVEEKRVEIEKNKSEIFVQKQELDVKRAEQNTLLAESEQRKKEYESELASLQAKSNDVNSQVTKLIMQRFNEGQLPASTPVKKGDIVGFQGHTGFSYGSHLHFVYFNSTGGSINPFSTGLLALNGSSVVGAEGSTPLDGAVITQGCHSPGCAIDMVGRGGIEWWTQTYSVAQNQICCFGMCVAPGTYFMNGEGTPIRSVKDGMVSNVGADACGGKYVVVKHNDNTTSLYLHLK